MTKEFYGSDLAVVQDEAFTEVGRSAALTIREVLQRIERVPGAIVDIGCGSGVTEESLGNTERPQIGLDVSSALIAIARRRAPHAHFQVGTLADFEFPTTALVCAINEVVNYALGSLAEPPFLFQFIDRAAAALTAGGCLVFDVAGPGRVPNGRSKGFVETGQWACMYEADERVDPPSLTREITTFFRKGEHYRRSHETHLQHLWAPEQVESYLTQRAFRVSRFWGYGGTELPKNSYSFVAQKS